FFFQAEDGIRDFHVTAVQTCALPICMQALMSAGIIPNSLMSTITDAVGKGKATKTKDILPAGGVDEQFLAEMGAMLDSVIVKCEIGRASCRKERRDRWWPYDYSRQRR